MGRRTKNLLLASGVTLASLLIGVEVAAYLTVPPIHVTSEGEAMVVFDGEIGMAPQPSAHTRRVYIVGDGHPSAAAHAIIAEEIAKYIRREKLL